MTSDFLQVGRTIKCGHCSPKEFGNGLKAMRKARPDFKCDCQCHDFKVALTGDKGCPHLHLEDMQAFLPYFIDAEFKKGKSKTRGLAILHVALFLDWCKKNVKCK